MNMCIHYIEETTGCLIQLHTDEGWDASKTQAIKDAFNETGSTKICGTGKCCFHNERMDTTWEQCPFYQEEKIILENNE